MKKIILLSVPCSVCNFRCSYCYLSTRSACYQNEQPQYQYSPKSVAKALSQKRLGGGIAYINICAEGETLLAKDIDKYVYELLKEGHYIEFVTNLTISSVLDKMLSWDRELLSRLEFKCSFHYLQLLEKKLLNVFADNVKKIWKAGASANIEITPHDELVPYIDDIKKFSEENFGALPHITIARNDATRRVEYLTNLSMEEYDKVWSKFHSDFWKFKKEIFMKKRKEFCYAGSWLLQVNLATGIARQCYKSNFSQNIFENIDKPITYLPMGRCREPHCYNGHMLLTLGCIPGFTEIGYGDIRNRVKQDGSNWLNDEMRTFLNEKLYVTNKERYTKLQQFQIIQKNRYLLMKKMFAYINRKMHDTHQNRP